MPHSPLPRLSCHPLAGVFRDKLCSCFKLSPRSDDAWPSLSTMTDSCFDNHQLSPGRPRASCSQTPISAVRRPPGEGRGVGENPGVGAGCHTLQGRRGGGKARPWYLPLWNFLHLHHHGWGRGGGVAGEGGGCLLSTPPSLDVSSMQAGAPRPHCCPGFLTTTFQHLRLCLACGRSSVNMH